MSKWDKNNRKKPRGSRCEAKTRSGRPCQNYTMPNGRCKMHGGVVILPKSAFKPGERRAWKHGLYSNHITEEEKQLLPEIPLGNIDDELKMLKLMLRRAYIFEQNQLDEDPFAEEIAEMENRLQKLEQERSELIKQINGNSD